MATQTIYTTKDSYIREEDPGQNYGTGDRLRIRQDVWGDTHVYRAVIGFNITTAPISALISSVNLYLHGDYYSMVGVSTYFRRITGSWTENGVTWNNIHNAYTTANQYIYTSPTAHNWFNYNITELYKDAKTAGNELGLMLMYVADNTASCTIQSREHNENHPPYILITYAIGPGDYYVKTTGNDALSGMSWANAWKTVNKAATTVPDGSTVHIGFGTYNAEPAGNKIAPQNIGANGIKYLPEAVGGGGFDDVTVIKN